MTDEERYLASAIIATFIVLFFNVVIWDGEEDEKQ